MNFFDAILPTAVLFLPTVVALLVCAGLLLLADFLLLRRLRGSGDERRFGRQIVMLVLTLVAAIVVILVLPISETTRGQLLSLLGLAVTAAITLSSATFVGNMMAGLMLRSVGNMRPGDYIRVDGHFGRVTVRGLFHTEIQTPDRDLTTLPNLYLVSTPVTVVRESGTIVSCEVSLGYDNAHADLEPLLLQAASKTGLTDSFVHLTELGDFSVGYRVAGFLADVSTLLSTRSNLRRNILDTLHGAGVEILSPSFMAQRPLAPETRVVPARPVDPDAAKVPDDAPKAEDIAFDKANQAEQLEKKKQSLKTLLEEIEELNKRISEAKGPEADALRRDLEARKQEAESLQEELAQPAREPTPA